jgi:hypothetical protein
MLTWSQSEFTLEKLQELFKKNDDAEHQDDEQQNPLDLVRRIRVPRAKKALRSNNDQFTPAGNSHGVMPSEDSHPKEKEQSGARSASASDMLLLPATTYQPPPPRVRILKPSMDSNELPPLATADQVLLQLRTFQLAPPKPRKTTSDPGKGLHPRQPQMSRDEHPNPRRWARARAALLQGEPFEDLDIDPCIQPKSVSNEHEGSPKDTNQPLRPRRRPLAERPINLADVQRSPSVDDIITRKSPRPTFKEIKYDVHKLSPETRSRLGDTSPRFDDRLKALLGEPSLLGRTSSVEVDVPPEPAEVPDQASPEVACNDEESLYSTNESTEHREADAPVGISELYRHALAGPYEDSPESESPRLSLREAGDLCLLDYFPHPPSGRPERGAIDLSRRAGHVWTAENFEEGDESENWSPFTANAGLEDSSSHGSAIPEHPEPPEFSPPTNQVSFEPFPLNETEHLPSLPGADDEAEQSQRPTVSEELIGSGRTRRKPQKKSSMKHLAEPKQTSEKKPDSKLLRRVKSFFTSKEGVPQD